MQLQRVRDRGLAGRIVRGVRRYNGVSLTTDRVLRRPHYSIRLKGKLAGWIGVELRGHRVCELCHLSVLPQFRRLGLGQTAFSRSLSIARALGASYVYARIRRSNYPCLRLIRKFGFHRTKGGRVWRMGRAV